MRRVQALLLLSLFSLSLIGPALSVDSQSDLPACCRRGGQHHCSMMSMDGDSASPTGPVASAISVRCPYFPKGGALLPHDGAALLATAQPVLTSLLSQLAPAAQAAAGYRISLARSHQKRGPPSLLS